MLTVFEHERGIAKLERKQRRLFWLCIVLVVLLVLSNLGWIGRFFWR